MFERLRVLLLRLLRVPPEPEPPFGDQASIRVFRASRKFYWLRMVRWGFPQFFALAGIFFWLTVIGVSEHEARRLRSRSPEADSLAHLPAGSNKLYTRPLRNVPPPVFILFRIAESLGLTLYFLQLAVTYAALRLDYELRWYIVTDRSLRIRSGVWTVSELTMSYANLQQVRVSQGPLERLLGISNVRVVSAGGGGSNPGTGEGKAETMHCGIFHGVQNAEEIRDLILDRLRRFRDSGLGDPDELPENAVSIAKPFALAAADDLLEAGRHLLAEARNLRLTVCSDRQPPTDGG